MSFTRTRLTQQHIVNMDEAINIFAEPNTDNTLPLVLVPSRSCCSFYMFVPDGVHVIMHKFGVDIGKIVPGLHFLGPWYKIAFLVSKQSCSYNAPVINCPTKDNIMVQVDLTIVFQIIDASKFVYDLGALKFDELLQAATEESIRALVRSTQHEHIYELRGSRATKFLKELNDKFTIFGVNFSDATITNVVLPSLLADTLQKETTFDSQTKEEKKSQSYQVKVINDNASLAMKQLIAKSDRLIADEIAKRDRALIQKGQSEIEAQRKKQLAIIKAEEDSGVLKYKAETELINSKIQGEKKSLLY